MSDSTLSVLIPAAGASTRLGQAKQLVPGPGLAANMVGKLVPVRWGIFHRQGVGSFQGTFDSRGALQGPGRHFSSDGQVQYEGEYVCGVREGRGREYDSTITTGSFAKTAGG